MLASSCAPAAANPPPETSSSVRGTDTASPTEGEPEPRYEFTGQVLAAPVGRSVTRPVAPPGIGAALADFYPRSARAQGVDGDATIQVTLSAAGEVTHTQIRSEEPADHGFGEACMATLRHPDLRWQPARDESGEPVEYSLRFVCAFRVRDAPSSPDANWHSAQ